MDNFLYEAIFIAKGHEKSDKEIIKIPELPYCIKDLGKDTDLCIVAESQDNLMGAIWTRILNETEKGFDMPGTKGRNQKEMLG
ncbi:MAG: hypothetical protein JXA61_06745 [Bacteroidales bacterium]|nr:hypothetical protein [Bacteroidales bacterium]